jgi:hypothetical protein
MTVLKGTMNTELTQRHTYNVLKENPPIANLPAVSSHCNYRQSNHQTDGKK